MNKSWTLVPALALAALLAACAQDRSPTPTEAADNAASPRMVNAASAAQSEGTAVNPMSQ